jgi:hypothetical protein
MIERTPEDVRWEFSRSAGIVVVDPFGNEL